MKHVSVPTLVRKSLSAIGRGIGVVQSTAALALATLFALTHVAGAQPVVGAIDVAGIMLCTNTDLTCTVTATTGTITNVSISYTTTLLGGGNATSFSTNANAQTTGIGTGTATLTYPLISNVIYTALTITALDDSGASGSTNGLPSNATGAPPEVLDTLQPALVIECEDYNFTNGGYMNTPPDGGLALYANEVGIQQTDFYWITAVGPATGYYRQTDEATGFGPQCENTGNNWPLMPQKFWTAINNGDSTDIPTEVGYNSTGNWLDFTRDFGTGGSNSAPAGTYNVWAFGSDDDTGSMFNMSLVTSSPTTSNQTTSAVLGTFSLTDVNWNNYYYVPMLDQYGNVASVTLSGHETIRLTVTGQANQDFIMLVPAQPVLSPVLLTVTPNTPFGLTNNLSFAVGAAQGGPIPQNGISLILNGQNVTSGVNLVGSTNSWVGTFALDSNMIYTATLSVSNSAGLISTFPLSFDTFSPNNYVWEAVDYDFSTNTGTSLPAIQGMETNAGWVSGLYIDNPTPTADVTGNLTGHLTNNSYFDYPEGILPTKENGTNGAVAQQGVDVYFQTITGEQIGYRNDLMGSQPATDYVRPKFLAAQSNLNDVNIGQYNIGWTTSGDWENYTRHYPSGKFNIYARIAGNAAWSGSQMALVTNGFGTDNQQYTVLGSFADPNAAGWQSFHWIPLVDSSGTPVGVELGGLQTLKFMCGGGVNELFYMLVPYAAPVNPELVTAFPDGKEPFQITNVYSFEVTSQAGPVIDNSGIGVSLNGVNVTGELTFSDSSSNTTVSVPITSNTLYNAVISVTNKTGTIETFYKTFDTFDVNNFMWEANDYDFTVTNGDTVTSAQFIDNPVPTCETSGPDLGTLETNSYFAYPGNLPGTSGALAGVDFFDQSPQPAGGVNDYYRLDGQGSAPSGDFLRPKFLAAQISTGANDVAPFQEGYTSTGDWGNYTRHWPPGTYNIYGRMAGNSAWSGTKVALVTSGVGTMNQTSNVLGSFADPNAAGWEVFHWVPLLNTNGSLAAVTLGGKQTLKVICGGGVNEEAYMLVQTTASVTPPTGPTLGAAIVSGSLNITIPTETGHTYTLLYSASLNPASWTATGAAITGDGSTHTVVESASVATGFYKVQVQ
jgi:hypothetical protein